MSVADTRRENLEKLLERFIPDNTQELINLTGELPALASVQRSRDGDWITLHVDRDEALAYFAQDDSDYVPTLLVDLTTGQAQTIEQDVSYRIADEPASLRL